MVRIPDRGPVTPPLPTARNSAKPVWAMRGMSVAFSRGITRTDWRNPMAAPNSIPTPREGSPSARDIFGRRQAFAAEARRDYELVKDIVGWCDEREAAEVRKAQELTGKLKDPLLETVAALRAWEGGFKVLARFGLAEADALLAEPIVAARW